MNRSWQWALAGGRGHCPLRVLHAHPSLAASRRLPLPQRTHRNEPRSSFASEVAGRVVEQWMTEGEIVNAGAGRHERPPGFA
jgi:hypothetical protein